MYGVGVLCGAGCDSCGGALGKGLGCSVRKAKGVYVSPGHAGPFKCTVGIPVDDDARRGDTVYGPFGKVRITTISKKGGRYE